MTPFSGLIIAEVAGPPSPMEPLPAKVMIVCEVSTLRTRLLKLSAMKIWPTLFTRMPEGKFNCAEVAGPLSPEKPGVPVPAMVEMTPVAVFTLRIR